MFKHLFSPIRINRLEIKNRIAYPSLGLLYSYERKLNDRYYNFYREIAKGGAGIVTVGPVGVDYVGSGLATLALTEDKDIPSFQKLTESIRNEGASPWIQLFHAGAYSHSFIIDNKQAIGPSEVYSPYSKATPCEMSIEDIKTVQNAFADAARRAKEAGFEGVEIIASAGYLITQFLSPLRNTRTDEYGGSLENRLRFPREIIALCRREVGADFPLGIRMAGNDFVKGSNTDTETPSIARAYEESGIDVINVTGGWHESRVPQLPMELPRTGYSYLALNIKKAVSIPVMASNRICDPADAEKILQDGSADMINLGRVLLADPFWPAKAQEGRADEIRPCVACSQGCTDSVFSGLPVFCIGNPRAGYEGVREITKTKAPKNVMVVGAGVAGLEAAVTATQAGHRVEIYEKEDHIGGQIKIAGAPPHKQELWEFERYYRTMLNKYNIPVNLSTKVTIDIIQEKKPDHVIVAEGAKPLTPPLDGCDSPEVLSSWDLLRENTPTGKEVAVIGGGAVGLETAMFIATKGTLTPQMLHFLVTYDAAPPERLKELMFNGSSKVTVFEMMPRAGKDVGRSTRWVLMSNLKKYGVEVITDSKVSSINHGNVIYEKDGETFEKAFDNVVIAAGSRSVTEIAGQMEKTGIPCSVIGDGVKPRQINDAIHGGFLAALAI